MYTEPIREPDGAILVPRRVEGPGGAVGDRMERLTPGHPEYDEWDRYLRGIPETRRPGWVGRAGRQAGTRL